MTDSNDIPQIDETRLQAIRRRIEEVAGDAPQLAKLALEQMMTRHNPDLKGSAGSAGRVGAQSGNVSELTAIAKLKPGGAERLRRIFGLVNGNFDGAQKVGTQEHRPLGSIMRVRIAAYERSSARRHALNARPRVEPTSIEQIPD